MTVQPRVVALTDSSVFIGDFFACAKHILPAVRVKCLNFSSDFHTSFLSFQCGQRHTPEERGPLVDADDWRCQTQDVFFSAEVSGVTTKNSQHDTARKAGTLEMLDCDFNTPVGPHVYTDGSSDAAVRNGGSGIHTSFSNGKTRSRSLAVGALSSNYRAGFTVLHEAARFSQHIEATLVLLCLLYRLQICCPKPTVTQRAA